MPRFSNLFALALVSTAMTIAQSQTSPEAPASADPGQFTPTFFPSQGKLFVVTFDKPDRRQSCQIQSFEAAKLVCSRPFGGSRTYLPKQVVALIVPGDAGSKIPFLIGFNAGLGAAIWATVALTAVCPACAAATGIAAFLFFDAACVTLIADDQPDRVLYLAPGQQLSRKLGYVESIPGRSRYKNEALPGAAAPRE